VATTVLLLDDDEDVLDAVAEIVALLSGRQVWKARSVAELSDLDARALASGLAILDINLGAGAPSGIEGLRWLRSHRFAGRIVFLTGHARGFPLVEEAYGQKDVCVFSKPMSVDQLRTLLAEAP